MEENLYIKTEKIENNYMLFVRLDTQQPYQPVIISNFEAFVRFFEVFLSMKLDDYLKLEEMIGNIGMLTMSEHISSLIHIIQQIINRGLKGLYFEVLTDVQEVDKEGNLEKANIFYDSRYHSKYHRHHLLLENTFDKMFVPCLADISDDDMIQNVINHFLSDENVNTYNEIYDSINSENQNQLWDA